MTWELVNGCANHNLLYEILIVPIRPFEFERKNYPEVNAMTIIKIPKVYSWWAVLVVFNLNGK